MKQTKKKIKKIISLMLCVCISSYTLHVFAMQSVASSEMEIQKIMLSDVEMNGLVGGYGALDAKVSDYSDGDTVASAVFINRTTISSSYQLVEADSNGNLISLIAYGGLNPNTAIIATGPFTGAGNVIQANIWADGFPNGVKATHSYLIE